MMNNFEPVFDGNLALAAVALVELNDPTQVVGSPAYWAALMAEADIAERRRRVKISRMGGLAAAAKRRSAATRAAA